MTCFIWLKLPTLTFVAIDAVTRCFSAKRRIRESCAKTDRSVQDPLAPSCLLSSSFPNLGIVKNSYNIAEAAQKRNNANGITQTAATKFGERPLRAGFDKSKVSPLSASLPAGRDAVAQVSEAWQEGRQAGSNPVHSGKVPPCRYRSFPGTGRPEVAHR